MNEAWKAYIPRDDIYLFNTGKARQAWKAFGCVYIPELEMFRFLVWAPNARGVSVVGDFNEWNPEADPMEKVEGGCWVCFMGTPWHGACYKYCIDGADGRGE